MKVSSRSTTRTTRRHRAPSAWGPAPRSSHGCRTVPGDGSGYDDQGPLRSLLAASDGSIWVAAGASVFHWRDGKLDEFSMFKDAARFPARTEMVSRVFETVDHKIWVVASNEGHLRWRGIVLDGGLLEYDGNAFKQVGKPSDWFMTSYTPISANDAIVGSTVGFAFHHDGRLAGVYDTYKNASYMGIVDKQDRGLFLGSRGVRFGDEWLFGTASGVVAYHPGADHSHEQWQLLEGLTAMLPDSWLLERGGRYVHAVETDPMGHIYAGTDRGLVISDDDFSSVGDRGVALAVLRMIWPVPLACGGW